jgi:HSP20 family protein
MAKVHIETTKTGSILDELSRLHQDISRRAYDFFRDHERLWIGPLEDWLRAERELVWRPAVELRRCDDVFELEAAVAGVEPKDLDVQVTPDDILIKAGIQHRDEEKAGTVLICEFTRGPLFRSIHLPERIDPDSVRAEYRNGLLRLTARIAKAIPKTVDVQAA